MDVRKLLVALSIFATAACGREGPLVSRSGTQPTTPPPRKTVAGILAPSPTPTPPPPLEAGAFLWRTKPLKADASPIFVDGTVYITGDGVYAIDATTGRIRWHASTPKMFTTPRSDGSRVYAADEDGQLYAFDIRNGNRVWHGYFGSTGTLSQPAVSDGILYSAGAYPEKYLVALVARTGREIWKSKISWEGVDGATWGSTVLADGTAFVGGSYFENETIERHLLAAFDAKTGRSRWTVRIGARAERAPVVFERLIYYTSPDHSVHALSADDGREQWTFQTDGPIASAPTIWNGTLYFGSNDGHLYALDARSGSLRWKRPLLGCSAGAASPEAVEGVVYMPAETPDSSPDGCFSQDPNRNHVLAFDAESGHLLWNESTRESGEIGSRPSVGDGRVYQTSGGRVVAFGR